MKIFYLVRISSGVMFKKEIGVFDYGIFLLGQRIIEWMAKVKLLASTESSVYLLDMKK